MTGLSFNSILLLKDDPRFRGSGSKPGESCLIEVSDMACSISEEILLSIFELFITIKSNGQGIELEDLGDPGEIVSGEK